MKKGIIKLFLVVMSLMLITANLFGQGKKIKVAAISGYFGQGFGKLITIGLDKAKKDFGIEVKYIDVGTRSLDYQQQFDNVAKTGEYDIVMVMGWELVNALETTSKKYPKQKFVFIDGQLESKSMYYLVFSEEQASFLAGALSAMMTAQTKVKNINSQNKIGFIGGRDIPVIRNFLTGFEQGAKYVDPKIDIRTVFAGTFDDPARGNELAQAQYASGVDIIFQAAGPTGEGVLMAAKSARKYAIGVDIDQCDVSPNFIMASVLKKADVAVYDFCKQYIADNNLKPGVFTYDIKTGGVGLCEDKYMKSIVPKEVFVKLEDLKKKVINGEIKIKGIK